MGGEGDRGVWWDQMRVYQWRDWWKYGEFRGLRKRAYSIGEEKGTIVGKVKDTVREEGSSLRLRLKPMLR
jgi:hypothetical protein